ncbi:hypothetical protein, partial [Enterococcus faecalis]
EFTTGVITDYHNIKKETETAKKSFNWERAWNKNHFGFLFQAQNLINGGNRTNSFGNKPKFSKN